jgi:hypothetical protein
MPPVNSFVLPEELHAEICLVVGGVPSPRVN